MKKNIYSSKFTKGMALAVAALLFPIIAMSQVRIDWQQCYGGVGRDYATGICKAGNSFLVLGTVDRPQSPTMIDCEGSSFSRPWLIRIDDQGTLQDQQCWNDFSLSANSISIIKAQTTNDEYYLNAHESGRFSLLKTDDGFNEIWKREIGYFGANIEPTIDGGVVLGHSYGHLNKDYDAYDSILKLDSQGNTEWRMSIGNMMVESITQSKDGGFFVSASSLDFTGEGFLLKLSRDGQLEWSRPYNPRPSIVLELEDGFLLACTSAQEGGDSYYGPMDIFLFRTDMDGNILWNHSYGGSSNEGVCSVYANPNGGFTVFGYAQSNDGDVQSNADAIYPMIHIWIFHVNGSGELVWEQTLGTPNYDVGINSVIQIGSYKYVLAGSMVWEETSFGDVNCSNSSEIPNSGTNFWVLQLTDTINSTGLPEPLSQANAQIYPNPTKGSIFIQGIDPVEVQVYNAKGQWVKSFENTHEIFVGDLPKGLYLIKAFREDGQCFTDKVVKE